MYNLHEAFSNHYNGSHWGVSDWYEDIEKAICGALESGQDFDTNWYGSKKEIVSARIQREGNLLTLMVSCSDDFDTEGYGEAFEEVINGDSVDHLIDKIHEGLSVAWERAEDNKKENAVYSGWSIGTVDENEQRQNWLYTYIQPIGFGEYMHEPPGCNYHCWGWDDLDVEEDCIAEEWAEMNGRKYPKLPNNVRKAFEEFINSVEDGPAFMVLDGWRADRWD